MPDVAEPFPREKECLSCVDWVSGMRNNEHPFFRYRIYHPCGHAGAISTSQISQDATVSFSPGLSLSMTMAEFFALGSAEVVAYRDMAASLPPTYSWKPMAATIVDHLHPDSTTTSSLPPISNTTTVPSLPSKIVMAKIVTVKILPLAYVIANVYPGLLSDRVLGVVTYLAQRQFAVAVRCFRSHHPVATSHPVKGVSLAGTSHMGCQFDDWMANEEVWNQPFHQHDRDGME